MNSITVNSREADYCCAAVNVGIGSNDEPHEVPGLAHFCEHMHALGSGKYPGEAYFKSFAGENGGKTNAFTASEGKVSKNYSCFFFINYYEKY